MCSTFGFVVYVEHNSGNCKWITWEGNQEALHEHNACYIQFAIRLYIVTRNFWFFFIACIVVCLARDIHDKVFLGICTRSSNVLLYTLNFLPSSVVIYFSTLGLVNNIGSWHAGRSFEYRARANVLIIRSTTQLRGARRFSSHHVNVHNILL